MSQTTVAGPRQKNSKRTKETASEAEFQSLLSYESGNLAWPVPTRGQIDWLGAEESLNYLRQRKQEIEKATADPLRFGYRPRIWDVVEENIKDLRAKFPSGVIKLIVWGGNRSSKTRFASNYVNRDCREHDGHRWWCCDSTEAMSRTNQMRLIHEQFIPEWRYLDRDDTTDIRYSLSDGFSKNKYVCPNKSEVEFKFYSMDIANLPGPELDGIWCDELVPLVWVETLVYRLINRNGLLIITFTPELGWNETIGAFYEGAQVVEDAEAPLLPKFDEDGRPAGFQRVPRVMQCADPMARIVYFHNTDNPFGNYPALVQQLKGKSEEEIGIRAYGVCTKSFAVAFPMFNRNLHVITEAQFAEIREEKGERYHLVDPCDGRMWFMIWVYCPHPDKWIIYREYPSYGNKKAYIQGVGMPGAWALSGAAADGVKGPGQTSRGFSLERYIDEIAHQESGETPCARYIDSRYATSPKSERERMTTLIEQLGEAGMDFMAMVAGKGRIIGTEANDGSVDMINSALYYDLNTKLGDWSSELGRLNEPQLQVLETCPNVIYALEHWTGQDGQKGACKDPVDCVRGMFLTSVNYVGDKMYAWQGGGIPR